MAQGERKKKKGSQKGANVQQGKNTRTEESLVNSKKEKEASGTDRRISEQDENDRITEQKQSKSSAQGLESESSQPE